MEYKKVAIKTTENGVKYIAAETDAGEIDRFPMEILAKNTPKTFRIKVDQWLAALEDGYRKNCSNQEVMMTMFEFLYEKLGGSVSMIEDYKAWSLEKAKKDGFVPSK